MKNIRQETKIVLIIFLSVMVLIGLAMIGKKQPTAFGDNVSQEGFLVNNVLSHLHIIATNSSPVSSQENEKVRDYLYNNLLALGLNPEIQHTAVLNPMWRTGATVDNIIARIPGSDSSKAILLVANYDTVPNSPGANSNKAAVASILEIARTILAGEQLKNDLIILLADAGEVGSLGAIAFVEQHPWMNDVGLVLNPEARGLSGPSILLGVSRSNGWLVEEYAKAIPRPIASSFYYELYRMMNTDNNFTVINQAQVPGFNLAYLESPTYYHTAFDKLENIEETSILYQGLNLVHLVNHFGNQDLSQIAQVDQVYFDVLGLSFFNYPITWIAHLITIALIFYGLVGWHGVQRSRISIKGIAYGTFIFLVIGLLSGVLMGFVAGIFTSTHPLYQYVPLSNGLWYLVGFSACTAAIFVLLYSWAFNKVDWLDLSFGAQTGWLLLTTVISLFLPGVSYIFIWPLLFSLLGTVILIMWEKPSWLLKTLGLLFSFVPVVVFWPTLIRQLFIIMGLSFTGILMLMVVLVLGLLIPLIKVFTEVDRRILPLMTIGLLVLSIIAINVTSDTTVAQPSMDSIFYYKNTDAEVAFWVSIDDQLDEFTEQFFLDGYTEANLHELIPYEEVPIIKGTSELDVEFPILVELVDKTIQEDIKELHLSIKVLQENTSLIMYIEPELVIGELEIEGNVVAWEEHWPVFRYYSVPAEGISLRIPTAIDGQFSITILSQSFGLPDVEGNKYHNRPDYLIPAPTPITDTTVISKTYRF